MSERKMPSVEDFPSNSNASKPAVVKDKNKPVVRGKVKRRSSIFRSVKDEFIAEDADNIGTYLLNDILFPALRDLINDICHGAIDAAFGGGGGRSYRSRRDRSYGGSYISYNRYYDDRSRSRRDREEERYESRRRTRDFDSFIFEYREDAEDVLDRLCDYLEDYPAVPVSYFYDISGMDVVGDWTAENWGWTNLAGTRVRKVRGGYVIDLPKVKPI